MRINLQVFIAMALLVAMCGIVSAATVTNSITYQGKLTNAAGSPLTGTYSVTFKLYDASTGGTTLSTDSHSVTATNGLFTTPITVTDPNVVDGRALWLGVKVGTDAEMTPRQEIRPVPYAISLRPGAVIIGDASANPSLKVINTGTNSASLITGTTGQNSPALFASAQGMNSPGVYGLSGNDAGVYGRGKEGGYFTTNSAGTSAYNLPVVNVSTSYDYNSGVRINTTGFNGYGMEVFTTHDYSDGVHINTSGPHSDGVVIYTTKVGSDGVVASTSNGYSYGVRAYTNGGYSDGIYASTTGPGSHGVNSYTWGPGSIGVQGKSNQSEGVRGESISAEGVHGKSDDKAGVWGESFHAAGVSGYSTDGNGLFGESALSRGVVGIGDQSEGVYGEATSAAGVRGKSTNGNGLYGESTNKEAIYGFSINDIGIHGATSYGSAGVKGDSYLKEGLYGESVQSAGVHGKSTDKAGVWGVSENDAGVYAVTNRADHKYGIYTPDYLYAKGTQVPAVDVAEYMRVTENVTPGTVLIIGKGGILQPSATAYDTSVAGIVSTAPGVSLGTKEGGNPGEAQIAVAGKVPCKVDASNGPIEEGDLLTTSDRPGYAMKAEPTMISGRGFYPDGTILGKAMGTLESGTGTIEVLVTLQ